MTCEIEDFSHLYVYEIADLHLWVSRRYKRTVAEPQFFIGVLVTKILVKK